MARLELLMVTAPPKSNEPLGDIAAVFAAIEQVIGRSIDDEGVMPWLEQHDGGWKKFKQPIVALKARDWLDYWIHGAAQEFNHRTREKAPTKTEVIGSLRKIEKAAKNLHELLINADGVTQILLWNDIETRRLFPKFIDYSYLAQKGFWKEKIRMDQAADKIANSARIARVEFEKNMKSAPGTGNSLIRMTRGHPKSFLIEASFYIFVALNLKNEIKSQWIESDENQSAHNIVHAIWNYADGKGDRYNEPENEEATLDKWMVDNYPRNIAQLKKEQKHIAGTDYQIKVPAAVAHHISKGMQPYEAMKEAWNNRKYRLPFQPGRRGISGT
jgi:hypothetical protein